jgi:hypothetical protein
MHRLAVQISLAGFALFLVFGLFADVASESDAISSTGQ